MRVKKTLMKAVVAVAGLAVAGCATPKFMEGREKTGQAMTQPMKGSDASPASQGTLAVARGASGNTALTVRVKHLAPADKLANDASVYVVWVEPEGAPPQNVGVLSVNKDLQGSLSTITPYRRFKVMVTPEKSGEVSAPEHDEVFTSEVDRAD